MSEKQISSPSLPELLAVRRKPDNLTNFHLTFLLDWHTINGPKMFGFQAVRGLDEQLKRAVALLKEAEKEWELRARNNQTSLQFHQFFFYSAVSQGVQLPSDFEEKYLQLTKGDKNERKRT